MLKDGALRFYVLPKDSKAEETWINLIHLQWHWVEMGQPDMGPVMFPTPLTGGAPVWDS